MHQLDKISFLNMYYTYTLYIRASFIFEKTVYRQNYRMKSIKPIYPSLRFESKTEYRPRRLTIFVVLCINNAIDKVIFYRKSLYRALHYSYNMLAAVIFTVIDTIFFNIILITLTCILRLQCIVFPQHYIRIRIILV